MKILPLAALLSCAQCAVAAPSQQVINACLATESIPTAHYTEISATDFNIEEDQDQRRNSTTVKHRGQTVGLWESLKSKDFGLVYNSSLVTRDRVVVLGAEKPATFDPYTAQWGEVRQGRSRYLCITFNFPGLGQSGSFQNVRGLYLIDVSKPPKFYYTVGDIRTIRN